jgi:hypothetical protein
LRRFILAGAGLLACCACAAGAPHSAGASETSQQAAIAWLGKQVVGYQQATWRWQRLMGVARTPTAGRALAEMSVPDVRGAVELWKRRALKAQRRARRPPHLAAFLCIHRYEAGWTDSGAPFYGGLQMDLGFQQRYGGWLLRRKGTANHWTPLEQIWTAEKAAKSRGFYPWPNTARVCGLM